MSLSIRYLSNGKRALYCVSSTGVTTIEKTTYESINDIPESIRHYAPKGEAELIPPDVAQYLGFGPDLFPELEKKCMYFGDPVQPCIGPGCNEVGEGSPIYCPYWVKEKTK